jgi:hypothetical protein
MCTICYFCVIYSAKSEIVFGIRVYMLHSGTEVYTAIINGEQSVNRKGSKKCDTVIINLLQISFIYFYLHSLKLTSQAWFNPTASNKHNL